ncbi:unnamed protein product, partial [Rotaria socialis]
RPPKPRKILVLIGVVCDDEIKDLIDLRSPKDKTKMEVKVPARKRDQLSINSGHTHFIIIREQSIGTSSIANLGKNPTTVESGEKQLEKLIDSAESATNKFRDRFEDFLHQEALQQPTGEQTTI